MSYIGLDVGTSGCKASVISECGTILFSSDAAYSLLTPNHGYVELNPAEIWASVKRVLKAISPYAHDAKTIAVSSIGESMVMLDKYDNILYNGIVYLDQRCQNTTSKIESKISAQELHYVTGVSLNQMFTLNKFLWFREHIPELLPKADKFFLFGDYITYMLSGVKAVDPGTASRTMFFDARSLNWSQTVGNLFEIPLDKFSKIAFPGTPLETIRPSLSKELGLPLSLTVIVGIHDQCAATLGAGALSPGDIMMGQGSTESINCVIHKNQMNNVLIERQICFEPYIDDQHYIIITGNLTHGSSINWFLRNFHNNSQENCFDFDSLYEDMPDDCGSLFFLPYLSKVNLMNAQNHALGGFLGVDITSTKPQMFRALLEGLCYETRVSLDIFKSINVSAKKMIAAGGASKSPVYMQMKSDIINYPLHILQNPQAGIIGLGMIGAVSSGDYSSYTEAAKSFVKLRDKVYTPKQSYSSKYKDYQIISQQIKQLYDRLEGSMTR